MSRENNRKKEEASGSGWGSSLLLAAGAGAVGYLASQFFSGPPTYCPPYGSRPGGSGYGARPSGSQRSNWEDIEGNNVDHARKRKENRNKASNANIPDEMKCVICIDNPKEMICYPCRHIALCEDCVDKVFKCPICNEKIVKKTPVYIS